jgi:hypothetical protein
VYMYMCPYNDHFLTPNPVHVYWRAKQTYLVVTITLISRQLSVRAVSLVRLVSNWLVVHDFWAEVWQRLHVFYTVHMVHSTQES